MCGTNESILDDRKIRIAPLELVKQTQDSDLDEKMGNFHHRKEVANILNKPPAKDIHYSQLFNEAKNHAVAASKNCCEKSAAQQKYQLVHGNIVGVVGQAGIGKSTLTKLLVREILDDDLYNAEYIFYLHFRDLNYEKEMNLLQFLTNDSTFSNTLTEEERKHLLIRLDENANICIIIDGFDESLVSDKSKPIKGTKSIYDTLKAEKIIKHILKGDLLPRAKKLVTSRPRQLFQLHKSYRPRFIVSILGLNETSQLQVCQDVCEDNDIKCANVLKIVNARPDLKSFCYTPVNCVLVMYCISVNFDCENLSSSQRLDSLSNILVATLALFVENTDHLRGEEFRTKKLSLLAFTTFLINKLVFEQEDLDNSKITEADASTFLTTRLGKKADLKVMRGKTYMKSYFSHLMLHEFFAALYLILFVDLDKFQQILSGLDDSKFEMVTKFAFGLCNSTTQLYLKEAIPSEEIDLSLVRRKKKLLKKLALKQAYSVWNFTDLPQVFSWIFELRDDELTKIVVSNLKSDFNVKPDDGLLPSDAPAYQYALQFRKTPLYLNVKFGGYVQNHWKTFVFVFDGLIQSGKVEVSNRRLTLLVP